MAVECDGGRASVEAWQGDDPRSLQELREGGGERRGGRREVGKAEGGREGEGEGCTKSIAGSPHEHGSGL